MPREEQPLAILPVEMLVSVIEWLGWMTRANEECWDHAILALDSGAESDGSGVSEESSSEVEHPDSTAMTSEDEPELSDPVTAREPRTPSDAAGAPNDRLTRVLHQVSTH